MREQGSVGGGMRRAREPSGAGCASREPSGVGCASREPSGRDARARATRRGTRTRESWELRRRWLVYEALVPRARDPGAGDRRGNADLCGPGARAGARACRGCRRDDAGLCGARARVAHAAPQSRAGDDGDRDGDRAGPGRLARGVVGRRADRGQHARWLGLRRVRRGSCDRGGVGAARPTTHLHRGAGQRRARVALG